MVFAHSRPPACKSVRMCDSAWVGAAVCIGQSRQTLPAQKCIKSLFGLWGSKQKSIFRNRNDHTCSWLICFACVLVHRSNNLGAPGATSIASALGRLPALHSLDLWWVWVVLGWSGVGRKADLITKLLNCSTASILLANFDTFLTTGTIILGWRAPRRFAT